VASASQSQRGINPNEASDLGAYCRRIRNVANSIPATHSAAWHLLASYPASDCRGANNGAAPAQGQVCVNGLLLRLLWRCRGRCSLLRRWGWRWRCRGLSGGRGRQ
jgi:hypothetical protein